MTKHFTLEYHYFSKALTKADITFPISKESAVMKADGLDIRVDYDRYIPLKTIIGDMAPDYYPNAASFWAAYMASQTNRLRVEYGVN